MCRCSTVQVLCGLAACLTANNQTNKDQTLFKLSVIFLHFNISLHLATLCQQSDVARCQGEKRTSNLHNEFGSIILASRDIFHFSQSQHPVYNSTKDNMLSIEEIAFRCRDEKLIYAMRVVEHA